MVASIGNVVLVRETVQILYEFPFSLSIKLEIDTLDGTIQYYSLSASTE